MPQWLRLVRGAVGMGLIWAVGWGFAGILIGIASRLLPGLPWDRVFQVFDAPLPALAVPGFLGGVLFSVILRVAARGRRFDQLSTRRFAVWGGIGGLALSITPAVLVHVGLATPARDLDLWRLTLGLAGPLILLGALSASGALMLARGKAERALPGARAVAAGTPHGEGEIKSRSRGND